MSIYVFIFCLRHRNTTCAYFKVNLMWGIILITSEVKASYNLRLTILRIINHKLILMINNNFRANDFTWFPNHVCRYQSMIKSSKWYIFNEIYQKYYISDISLIGHFIKFMFSFYLNANINLYCSFVHQTKCFLYTHIRSKNYNIISCYMLVISKVLGGKWKR